MHRLGHGIPMRCAVWKVQALSDCGESMTAGPAHRRRVGVDALSPAILPNAVIGLQREFSRLAAEALKQPKQSLVAEPRQAPIIEHGHRRENDAAIGVV